MNPTQEEQLFEAAAKLKPESRAAFLELNCASDPAMRRRVEALLLAHDGPTGFMSGGATEESGVEIRDRVTEPELVGQFIERYKLLEKIGEGGCGVVYVAEQSETIRRRVALKVIKLGMDTRQVVARFEAERQALAMMDHPNIAKVLDAGATKQGRPYFVMELVRGIRITDYSDQEKLSLKERLILFIRVCHAIQHAHQKGIIHRDIKPSNILVTLHDGVPVPKVIDFGIAKATEGRLTDATVYTQLHQFIGTPAYMSPEQAEMSGLDIDTRTDVYSLGVLLYELLTGTTPFDGKALMASGIDEMRRTIREIEPPRPSTRLTQAVVERDVRSHTKVSLHTQRSTIPSDLDWIVMKCLEKDRNRRFETANGLAADVKRHLNSEPVVARPPSTAYRFRKAWRRNQAVFTASAIVALALAIALTISVWQAVRATKAERLVRLSEQGKEEKVQQALEERDRANRAQEATAAQILATREALATARRNSYIAEVSVGYQALAENNIGRARDLLQRQQPTLGEEDLRGFEWYHLRKLCEDDPHILLREGVWEAVRFSSDNRFLATGSGQVIIRDAGSREVLVRLETPANALSFAPNLNLLAVSDSTSATLWDIQNWTLVRTLSGAIHPSLFSPDSRWLLTGSVEGFRLWSTEDWEVKEKFLGAPQMRWHGRNTVAFSPDSKFVVFIAGDRFPAGDHLEVWQIEPNEKISDLRFKSATPGSAAFSRDGQHIIAGLWDGKVEVVEFRTGKIVASRQEHASWVTSVRMPAQGNIFTTASNDRTVVLWDSATFQPIKRLRGHTGEIWALDISPDGREVISSSVDRTTRLWSTAASSTAERMPPAGRLAGFTADEAGLIIVTSNSVIAWRPSDNLHREFPDRPGTQFFPKGHLGRSFDISRQKPLLVRGKLNGEVEVLGLSAGNVLNRWQAHSETVTAVALSSEGDVLATADRTGDLKIWDFATLQQLKHFRGAGASPYTLAFSPKGGVLGIAGQSRQVFLWNWRAGEVLNLEGNGENIFSISFSPDGELLAVATQVANEVRVFESKSGKLTVALKGHVSGITSVAFSPDGKTLATAGGQKLKLWNVAAWQEMVTFGTAARLPAMNFSPGGQMLAVWDLSDAGVGIEILNAPVSPNDVTAPTHPAATVLPASAQTR